MHELRPVLREDRPISSTERKVLRKLCLCLTKQLQGKTGSVNAWLNELSDTDGEDDTAGGSNISSFAHRFTVVSSSGEDLLLHLFDKFSAWPHTKVVEV